MVSETVIALGVGALGGVARATVGMFKALAVKMKIEWSYWIFTVIVAAIIGAFTGMIFNFDLRLSALAGYAGTDIIEGIYRSFKVDKVYVKNSRSR